MNQLENLEEFKELSFEEAEQTEGGLALLMALLTPIGIIGGLVYIGGEVAYELGRRYGNCNNK